MNAGNNNNTNAGVDHHTAAERANGDLSINPQMKSDQEHQDTAAGAVSPLKTMSKNPTTVKEGREGKHVNGKQSSMNSDTDPTQSKVKTPGPLKNFGRRLSTMVKFNRNRQQSHDTEPKESNEDGQEGEKISSNSEQLPGPDSPQNGENLFPVQLSALSEEPTDISATTEGRENNEEQQDGDHGDFVQVEHPFSRTVSDSGKRIQAPAKTSEGQTEITPQQKEQPAGDEMALTSLQQLVTEHGPELTSLQTLVTEHGPALTSLLKLLTEHGPALTSLQKAAEQGPASKSLQKLSTEHGPAFTPLQKPVTDQGRASPPLQKLVTEPTAMSPLQSAMSPLWSPLSPVGPTSPTLLTDQTRETKTILWVDEVTTSPTQERSEVDLIRKPDSISLTEVANLVKELNAQIDQVASLVMDLLADREPAVPSTSLGIAWDELRDYLGPWLCDELYRKSEVPEINPTIAQISLQTGLVYACNRIINDWDPPSWVEGLAFSRLYNDMAKTDLISADKWKIMTRHHLALREEQPRFDANKKYLEEVLAKLIAAIRGSLQTEGIRLCNEKVDDITRKAIDIHKIISQQTRSTDLSTFIIESGADFDPSRMEDTDESNGKATSKVVCTVDMGLRGRKRVSSRQQSGDNGKAGGMTGVTLKAKVVLLDTLGEL